MSQLHKADNLARLRYLSLPLSVLLCWVAVISLGCNRAQYRQTADEQAYAIINAKAADDRWALSDCDITPDQRSRFFDPYDLDYPPLPPDDSAAHASMHCVAGMRGWKHWHEFGQTEHVENPDWPVYLGGSEFSVDGGSLPTIEKLTLPDAIELGLVHGREYQEQLEDVYLSALALTYERYRFNLRPRGFLGEPGTEAFYEHQPDDASGLVLGPTNLGVRKLLPSGAQMIAELTNNTIWMFSGSDGPATATSFAYSLVQPLLSGASREIVLERLTQAERNVLYATRGFARFRKDFFVMILTGERALPLPGSAGSSELAFLIRGERSPTVGFYYLLVQFQRVRNSLDNVRSLERRLRDVRAMSRDGTASSLDVTQVQSSLESARTFQLFRARYFGDQLDRFKLQLGLPPDLELAIDDSLLEPFEFRNLKLGELEDQLRDFDTVIESLRETLDEGRMRDLVRQLAGVHGELAEAMVVAEDNLKELRDVVPLRGLRMTEIEKEEFRKTVSSRAHRFQQLRTESVRDGEELEKLTRLLQDEGLAEFEQRKILDQIASARDALSRHTRQLNGLETSMRVELIALTPVNLTPSQAVAVALENRLDLMNRRALVMDARRRLEVAADRLEANLDLVAEGEVNTPALSEGNEKPFEFRAKESAFRVGVSVKTPLDRRRERNDFRAAQVAYQRARRNYMAAEDQVKLDVRHQLRQLRAEGGVFEIQRRALRIAARELSQALDAGERQNEGEAAMTQQGLSIPRALENILDAQDSLIDTWLDYETARLELFRDMGVMEIDETGVWPAESQSKWSNAENGEHRQPDDLLGVPAE